eukprot:gene9928-899_t
MEIVVVADFYSNAQPRVLLRKGRRGVIDRVYDDGDITARFMGLPAAQWVRRSNVSKLQAVVAASSRGMDSDAAATKICLGAAVKVAADLLDYNGNALVRGQHGTVNIIFSDGEAEIVFADGSRVVRSRDFHKLQ